MLRSSLVIAFINGFLQSGKILINLKTISLHVEMESKITITPLLQMSTIYRGNKRSLMLPDNTNFATHKYLTSNTVKMNRGLGEPAL